MQTVYKYRLEPGDPCVVEMPRMAHVIHVGAEGDAPVLWAWVDTNQPMVRREYYVYGTGHPQRTDVQIKHLGSCQTPTGLVWHVFVPLDGLELEVSAWLGMLAQPKV